MLPGNSTVFSGNNACFMIKAALIDYRKVLRAVKRSQVKISWQDSFRHEWLFPR